MNKTKLIFDNEQTILDYVDAPTATTHTFIGSVYPDYSGAEFVVYDANNKLVSEHWISNKGITEAIHGKYRGKQQ